MIYRYPLGDLIATARVAIGGTFVGAAPGFSAVLLAANVFTLTLYRPIDSTMSAFHVSPENTTVCFVVTQTNDTTIEVRGTNVARAAAAGPFSLIVFRKAT